MREISNEKNRIDMVRGPLTGKIMSFVLPLIATGILQQSFNSVDIAVVGKFASQQALAAVGSNGMIISVIINLFLGISVGANVVIANYIGSGNKHGIHRAVDTVCSVALASGIILLTVGICIARPILEMMDTPSDVINLATRYLRIYFLGMPFMMIYNFGASVLRSKGDTKRPFYVLIISGIINVLLNLVLVICFDMNVAGVAIATVVSNIISAAIIFIILKRESEPFKLTSGWGKIYKYEIWEMMRIGIPAGVQGMIFSFANIIIQSAVNSFGTNAIAGSAAALNYEYYCFYVIVAFAQAATAFTGQNFGAGKIERCRKACLICLVLSIICCGSLNLFIVWQKEFFTGVFTDNPEVMHYAYFRLRYILMWQFIASSYEITGASLRGMGYSLTPTILTVFGTCLLRIGWIWTICRSTQDITLVFTVYPLSWAITGIFVSVAWILIIHRLNHRIEQSISKVSESLQ